MEVGRAISIFVLLSILLYQEVQSQDELNAFRCPKKNSNDFIYDCTECLWTKGCIWCKDAEPSASVPEGGNPQKITKGCLNATAVCSNKYESKVTEKNEQRHAAIKDAIQADTGRKLSPETIPIAHTPILLNPVEDGEVLFKLKISFAHPVDMYALMDLSGSMRTVKVNLGTIAHKIANALKSKTNDYRLAYGSYRDKPRYPFGNNNARRDYAFHHIMDFTTDVDKFRSTVDASNVNGGADAFESGMDGIMQAIACQDEIWTSETAGRSARKILVFFTDNGNHAGRDGGRSGILTPADYRCHLKTCDKELTSDPEGCIALDNVGVMTYEDQLKRDYPSYSQIRKMIHDNNIHMIFAATKNMINYFKKFSEFIGQPDSVGELTPNANQMAELIKTQYDSITRAVKVVDNTNLNSDIKIRFTLDPESNHGHTYQCNSENSEEGFSEDNFECTGTDNEDVIWVKAYLVADKETCMKNPTGTKNIHLFAFQNDQLDLTYKCEECECGEAAVLNAPECNKKGSLLCGGCKCNPGYKGRFCECQEGVATQCSHECKNSKCECGKCKCKDGFVGKCCQFKDCEKGLCTDVEERDCGGSGNQACSDGNGKCLITQELEECNGKETGTCQCRQDTSTYNGTNCECCEAGECQKQCFTRFAEKEEEENMCSGKGDCNCEEGRWDTKQKKGEKCKCEAGFEGTYCQRDKNDDVCQLLEPCAKHRMTVNDKILNNPEWEEECMKNLIHLGFVKSNNASIVRVGCHSIENGKNEYGSNSSNNDLSKILTLSNNASSEIEADYCRLVMSGYNMKPNETLNVRSNFDGTWSQFDSQRSQLRTNDSEDAYEESSDYVAPGDTVEEETKNKNWKQVDITKWVQCTIVDAEEVGCDECDVRFYHNILLESDKIFAPIEDDDQAITEPQILVGMHNLTEGGDWQYCLNCNPFPLLIVLVSSISIVLGILIALFITAIVIINLNDYRRYKQYLDQKKEAETMMDMQNPHFQDPNTNTQNPMFQQGESQKML